MFLKHSSKQSVLTKGMTFVSILHYKDTGVYRSCR